MPAVRLLNLSEKTHRALKVRALYHGHSAEEEIREILENVVRPAQRVRMGEARAAFGQQIGL